MTRVIAVEPTISLFPPDMRRRIMAAIPQLALPLPPPPPRIFETGIVRSERWALDNPRNISFMTPSPRLLLGLCALDFEHFRTLRIDCMVDAAANTTATINLKSWGDTRHAGTSCSWLSVPADDDDIQCGSYDINADHPWYKPQEVTTYRVAFARPYAVVPRVTAWFYKLDLHHGTPNRITVRAEDVTREGFTIHIGTWHGSIVYGAAVSWIALSPGRTDITCGTYTTFDVRPSNGHSPQTSGRHTFADPKFNSPPRLFLAISSIDFAQGINVRFNELCATRVTGDGFDWHLDTRDGSVLYTAAAAYIAFAS